MDRKRNLLPEYVWMIFVGILLAIIILMHITPGHADVSSSPSATPIPTSALDPTDACLVVGIHESDYMLFTLTGSEIFSLSISELYEQAYFVRYGSAGDSSLFLRDVKIALTQLKSQFQGFFVSILDLGASLNAYNAMYSAISEVGVPISLGYTDFSQNRVLQMVNTNFINAPVWLWNSNIPTPSPSPTPGPSEIVSILVKGDGFWGDSSVSSNQYYLFDFEISRFGSVDISTNNNNAFNLAYSNYGVDNPWTRDALVYTVNNGQLRLAFYFSGNIFSCTKYNLGSSLGSLDFDFIRSHYEAVVISSGLDIHWAFSSPLSGGYIWFEHDASLVKCSLNFNTLEFSGLSQNSSFGDSLFDFSASSVNYAIVQGYRVGLSGSSVPNNPEVTSSPTPSPTLAPLPTSGESIHVILPSGTPTPTPPFTIQPGVGGGNGSPGSFGGSGLSSGETSGILQAFSMYVSDNPVFAFLGGLFSAFPAQLMFPLYILLFILIILGIIRVFIHFTGG